MIWFIVFFIIILTLILNKGDGKMTIAYLIGILYVCGGLFISILLTILLINLIF